MPHILKIIVVEDEPDTAEMFAEMMRLSGYEVMKSFGGKPAMDMIVQEQPDAVVLDLMMPDISGLEVLHFMQKQPALMKVPVIVVSAKSMASDIREGLDAGAAIYLTKPVAFLELKKAVEDAIQKKSAA